MMRRLLLGAAVYGGLASAYTDTITDTSSRVVCSTAYGSGGSPPTPIPTVGTTRTTSSVTTSTTLTVPSAYTRVTPTIVTTTQRTSYSITFVIATTYIGTWTDHYFPETTIATATFPVTSCTNGVQPVTVTSYTGTYTPQPGQSTAVPASYPTRLFCTTSVTEVLILLPTVTIPTVSTIYTTPTTTVYAYTTSAVSTITYVTVSEYQATVTVVQPSYVVTGVATTTRSACQPTVTKTLNRRCSRTNLVADHNGVGLVTGEYADGVSVVYTDLAPYGSDPSRCCQLCLDNPGCGAAMWGPWGTCGLYYRGNSSLQPVCNNLIFTYGSDAEMYLGGQGIVVSEGCGDIYYQ